VLLKLRNQPVALLLVDHRMPQMTGLEFLEQAMQLFLRLNGLADSVCGH